MSKNLVRVTDLSYEEENDKPIVRVVGRDENDNRNVTIIGGTEPYCFVPPHETANQDCVVREEHGYEGYDGQPLKKVVTKLPKHVKEIRDDFSVTYEADIPFTRRSSVDYGLSGYIRVPDRKHCDISEVETDIEESDVESIDPRVIMADIEALPDYGIDFDEFTNEAPGEIIMITAYDTHAEEYDVFVLDPGREVDTREVKQHLGDHWNGHELAPQFVQADIEMTIAKSESTLLNSFLDYIEDLRPDLLSGWNWEDFDHRYLINRMGKVDGVDPWRLSDVGGINRNYRNDLETTVGRIEGLPGFDMMNAYCDQMVFSDWRSKSLDYVSNEELGVGKVEDINIREGYEKDRSRLTAYNIIDTQLLVALDDMADIHGFFYQLSDLTGVPIYDTFSAMRLVDGFVMSRRNDDEILPNSEGVEVDNAAGGLVLAPSSGIAEWVGVIDLKSLYPSSIMTGNISKECMTDDNDEADVIVPWMPVKEDDFGGTIEREHLDFDAERGQGLTLDEEGIMPKYLKLLFSERESMKDKRNDYDPGTSMYQVWDHKQRAVKVIMNCFTEDTDVMTPTGVRSIEDIEVGDEVYSIDPDTGDCHVKSVTETTHQRNLYGEVRHLQTRNIDFKVTPNHNMLVSRYDEDGYGLQEIQNLEDTVYYKMASHTSISGEEKEWFNLAEYGKGRVLIYPKEHGRTFRSNLPDVVSDCLQWESSHCGTRYLLSDLDVYSQYKHSIHEKAESVELQYSSKHSSVPVRYKMNDWLRLMGWFIAEGSCYSDNTTANKTVQLAQCDSNGKEKISSLLSKMGIKESRDSQSHVVSNTVIHDWLEENVGSYSEEKSIPEFVYQLSTEQKQVLMETMFAGDGHGNQYTTNSDGLKDDVCKLFVHLGYKPVVYEEEVEGYSNIWRITRNKKEDGFRKHLNEAEEVHTDSVHCITVEDNHTVLAGRNGKFQWVGQSFFGVSNNKYYRLASPELGDTITGLSRFILWTGVEICEELGYEVLYGDTDSVMVSLADDDEFSDLSEKEAMEKVVERGKEVERRINEEIGRAAEDIGLGDDHPFIDLSELPHNLPDHENHAWAFEFEKLFRRFFQHGKKKRYAGGCVWKEGQYITDENGNITPKPSITGYESERSDSPELTEEAQPEVIKMILDDADFEGVSEYLKGLCDDIREQNIDLKKIAKPGSINDPLGSYSSPTQTVRAALYSNEHLEYDWSHGDQPWVYFTDKTPPMKPHTDVLALEWWDDIPDGFDLDSEKHIEKTLKGPLGPMLEEVGWDFDELAAGARTEGVDLGDNNNSNPFESDDDDDGDQGVLSW